MDLLTSELWTALFIEQYDLANQLINRGANVNEPKHTQFGVITLLHYAAAIGDIQCMRLLINHGANLHALDTKNRTPLHWAVKTGDRYDVVEVLINERADLDARDFYQRTPLHLAAKKEFNESAQRLIARGASTEAVDALGETVLHIAVFHQNLSMVKVLISHGVNIDAQNIYGNTPLSHARNKPDIMQLLLKNGADIHTLQSAGHYPLCYMTNDYLASVTILLKWGACVNKATVTGETALHNACSFADTETVALLLKFGANLNVRNDEGKTPFELLGSERSCSNPSTEPTARILIREAVKREALGQPLCEGYTEMAQSCENYSQFDRECREEIMRMQSEKFEDSAISLFHIFSMDEEELLALGRNKKIITALETSDFLASFRIYAGEFITKFEMVKKHAFDMLPPPIVRKTSTYVNSRDIIEVLNSELWIALILGQYDLANRLIYRGANVNEPRNIHNEPAMSLLHYAAERGDIEGMRLLLKHDANCNGRDSQERTPLHSAVCYRAIGDRSDVIEVLINAGATVDARDKYQLTPLLMAVDNHCNESAQKLIARGASVEAVDNFEGQSVLHKAVFLENLSMVKVLIRHGVNMEVKDIHGFTPLELAVQQDDALNMDVTQLLLENGADVNTKDQEGWTPLFNAVSKCRDLYLLLKCGARVNEASNTGETALHMACQFETTEAATLLLKFRADLSARNYEGKTPFEVLGSGLWGSIDSPSTEPTARILIREAVKREALGQPLCEGYKKMAQSRENYSQFDRKCREEIMRMQSEKFEDSTISFFHILSMDDEKLLALGRNKKIVTAFETSDLLASFRIYAGELMRKFEVAKKRANFLMNVEDYLDDVLSDIVPLLIVRKIATYVKSGDIIEIKL